MVTLKAKYILHIQVVTCDKIQYKDLISSKKLFRGKFNGNIQTVEFGIKCHYNVPNTADKVSLVAS